MKAQAIQRSKFLRGQFTNTAVIRPPWSIDESRFVDTCTRCYKCAEACPSNLIVKGTGGYPEISFQRHGCDYCQACVQSCTDEALLLTSNKTQLPWLQQAEISELCFSSRGIVCRSCAEVCETSAIKFTPVIGGTSQINLNATACNGCGECVHVCPAHAIKIQKKEMETIHE